MGMNVGTSTKGRVAPQMNVTPLVDVVLVLLIIFMVVTPLLTKKFWLHVPKKEEAAQPVPPPPSDQKPLVIAYQKNGSVKLNAEEIPVADLDARLRAVLASRNEPVLFFDAETDADYGEAVHVMDVARGAGATNIAVVTEAFLP